MKVFFYYFYYRLFQWSEKRDKDLALFITVAWLTFTLISNAVVLCALVSISLDVDVVSFWLWPRGNKYIATLPYIVYGLLVWIGLRFFHVHEKAFSDDLKQRYVEVGCKGWWVISYYITSYILMAVLMGIAGGRFAN